MSQKKAPNPNHSAQLSPMNEYQQPLDAPISQPQVPEKFTPWQFGRTQKIATKQIRTSRANIKNPGTLSNIATAIGTIGAGSTLFVLDSLTPLPPHINEMNFAIPYIAVYAGTEATPVNQLYPILGGSQSWGAYSFQADNDWNAFSTAIPGSISSNYNLTIHNNGMGPGTFFYVSQYKFFNFNSGTVS